MATTQESLIRDEDQSGPSWQNELSFRDWKAGLEAARANYASAPSNLKLSLLLHGADLQEATSWMVTRARDLSPQQLSFIRKSIARSYSRAADEHHQLDQERKKRLKWWISFGATNSAFLLFLGLQFTLYDLWVKASGAVYVQQEARHSLPAPAKPASVATGNSVTNPAPQTAPIPSEEPREVDDPRAAPDRSGDMSPGQLAIRALEEAERNPVRARLIALEAIANTTLDVPLAAELLPALAVLQTGAGQQLSLAANTSGTKTVRASISRDGRTAVLVSSGHAAQWANISAAKPGLMPAKAAIGGPLPEGNTIVGLDSAHLAISDGGEGIRVWSAGTPQPAAVLRGHEAGITALAMSRDKRRIVTASWDETVRVWSVLSGRTDLYLRGHQGPALTAAFSADGTLIVTAGEDRTVRIWSAVDGRPLTVLTGHASTVETAAFDPTGTRVLTTSLDGTARIWNVASGQATAIIRPPVGIVARASFGMEGRRLAVQSNRGDITIWGLDGGAPQLTVPAGTSATQALQLGGRDDTLLLTLSVAGVVTVMDAIKGTVVGLHHAGKEDRIVSAEFLANGREVVAITERNQILRWKTHHSLREVVAEAREATPRCLSGTERSALGLDPALPKWCQDLSKATTSD